MKKHKYLLVGKLLCALGIHKKQIDIYNDESGQEFEHWGYSCSRNCDWSTVPVPRNQGDKKPRHAVR